MITTKDLGALNELMTFENWMALKLYEYSRVLSDNQLKKVFNDMLQIHIGQHAALLNYLETKSKGSKK